MGKRREERIIYNAMASVCGSRIMVKVITPVAASKVATHLSVAVFGCK